VSIGPGRLQRGDRIETTRAPKGFDRLQPWVIDPNTGFIVTLGAGPGQGGIGTRTFNPQPVEQ